MTNHPQHNTDQTHIPTLRFKEFEGEWEKTTIGNQSIKVGSGVTPRGGKEVYEQEGIIFIRSQNVNNDRLDLSDVVFIPLAIDRKMKASRVQNEDILLNITGASIGRSCVVPNGTPPANVNQHVCIIRLISSSPYFLQSFLSSWRGQKLIFQGQAGGGREGINFEAIKKIKLHLPSLPEQQKIAAFLSAVDRKIRQLTRKKELLEQYKKGVMQRLFPRKPGEAPELRFKDESGNDFPDWEERRLGDFCEVKRGAGSQYINYISDKEKGIRLIRIGDFLGSEPAYVTNSKEMKRFSLKSGDILIAGTGATAGITFRVPKEFDGLRFSYNAPRIRVLNGNSEFISYYLKSDSIKRQQLGLFTGNAQHFLDTKAIRNFKISAPSDVQEQQKIASFLSGIDEKIGKVHQQIFKTQEFKRGLLQQMFI